MEKDAKVRVGVEGAQDVARAAEQALTPWQKVGQAVGGSFAGVAGAVGGAVQGILSDLGHVVTAANAISFSGARDQVLSFEDATARLAASSGKDLGAIRQQLETISGIKGIDAANWTASVGSVTRNFEGARQSIEAFQKEAIAAGRSLTDEAPLAKTLHTIGMPLGLAAHTLGELTSQAERLGVTGGPAALKDQIVQLGGALSQVSIKGEQDLLKLTGLMAAAGHGLNEQAAGRVSQSLVSNVTGNVHGYERFLGVKYGTFTDEHGQVRAGQIPEILEQTRKRVMRMAGGDEAYARFIASNKLGDEGAAALFNLDFGKLHNEEQGNGAVGAAGQSGAWGAYLASDAGKRAAAAARQGAKLRESLGSGSTVGDASDAFGEFSADHPFLASVAGPLGLKTLSGLLGGVGAGAVGTMLATQGGRAGLQGVARLGPSGARAAWGALSPFLGGAAGLAGGGLAVANLLPLMGLGEGSSTQHGFGVAGIGAIDPRELAGMTDEQKARYVEEHAVTAAGSMRERASRAEREAAGNRSEGMQSALELEQARLQQRRIGQHLSNQGLTPEQIRALGDAIKQGVIDGMTQVAIVNFSDDPVQTVKSKNASAAGAVGE